MSRGPLPLRAGCAVGAGAPPASAGHRSTPPLPPRAAQLAARCPSRRARHPAPAARPPCRPCAGGVYSVAWSPRQADLVATGGADDRAYIWRVGQEAFEATGGAVLELSGHTDTVSALAFSADGASLASGGMDGRVKVWEVATGRCTQTLEGPGDAVEWLQWHPKGGVLLAGAADFTAWMWLAATGACMQVRRRAGAARVA